ncbi:MAG: tRNA lysidine(34) synthetase TilS [Bdellovibrionales bacterium]|nr:tRNA lysidine(34) synthetase TilS [Bdellovibrionales bacterium]
MDGSIFAPLKKENIFHQVLKDARRRPGKELWGLCVSGGLDSICLLEVLPQVAQVTGHELLVFHVHHGVGKNEKLQQFRQEALNKVEEICKRKNLRLLHNLNLRKSPSFSLSDSEASLREYRWRCLQKICEELDLSPVFLTAHHRDDVLETRMIQLLRGVGPKGFIQFQKSNQTIWRPFFDFSREDLYRLAQRHDWSWVEDPSNDNTRYLRNWLRKDWFPQLEGQRPGSLNSLHRSLDLIVEGLRVESRLLERLLQTDGLHRGLYNSLSPSAQRQVLAEFIEQCGIFSHTKGQLEEIQKRLDAKSHNLNFHICGLFWSVSKTLIKAVR